MWILQGEGYTILLGGGVRISKVGEVNLSNFIYNLDIDFPGINCMIIFKCLMFFTSHCGFGVRVIGSRLFESP